MSALFSSIILDANWPINKNSFIQSFNNHVLGSYYSLGFVVVIGYTKDAKTDEASALVELTF